MEAGPVSSRVCGGTEGELPSPPAQSFASVTPSCSIQVPLALSFPGEFSVMDKQQFPSTPRVLRFPTLFLFSLQGAISTLQIKAVTGRRVWNDFLNTQCLHCKGIWCKMEPSQGCSNFLKAMGQSAPKPPRGAGVDAPERELPPITSQPSFLTAKLPKCTSVGNTRCFLHPPWGCD